ncbi:MAG: DEAD/DEAH box helicase, partial [Sphingobacteriales bacterium]
MQPEDVLKKFWNYESFRSSQREIIQAVLAGRDTIALLPTGGGKSLCYQVPALLLDGICIVISPLISLMQDQVKRLDQLGIPAMALHAGLPFRKLEASLHSLQHGPYKLLYISPERLQHWRFRDCLPELNISMIAVDEAHCISQWGHDFRPDYLKIENLRTIFPHVP